MTTSSNWEARIHVRRPTRSATDRLVAALAPEAAREVPRTRTELRRPAAQEVELRIDASDTSACRAALNTYLGWIGLVLSTERAVETSVTSPGPGETSPVPKRLS